jgi:hypothetical protein
MKNLFFMSLLALMFAAAGCSKDDENRPMPTENGTKVDPESGKIVRTQLVNNNKEAVVITYSFNVDDVKYQGQEWEIIFGTKAGALAAYGGYQAYYAASDVKVSNSANVVKITYPLGKGLGDEQLQAVNSLDAAKNVVQVLDVLEILNLK